MPDAIVIAGPNGAGKTTFARQAGLSLYSPALYLNADEIQREHDGSRSPIEAGRELLRRLEAAEASRRSFMIETTLSSANYSRNLLRWKKAGFQLILHFIELPSADVAVARVSHRVANGGHSIFEADVRRRFERGLARLAAVKAVADEWFHWMSDGNGLREMSYLSAGPESGDRREALLEVARRANWDSTKGPPHLRAGRFWTPLIGNGSELVQDRKPETAGHSEPNPPSSDEV